MKDKTIRFLRPVVQIVALILFWQAGNLIVGWLAIPLPGSVIGLALLLLLLGLRIIPLAWLEDGTHLLLREMLLFFVPAVIGVIQYFRLLALYGWRIVLAIAASTIIAMVTAGLLVEGVVRLRGKDE